MGKQTPGFEERPPQRNTAQSKKHGKQKSFVSKSAFSPFNLSASTLRALEKKGYRQPTPIQRKVLPIALEGRDVVGMARTGSGKTACFILPMLERLRQHAPNGARALVISPTRELAAQTHKFIKELGRFTDLRSALILGGDSFDKQFALFHQQPDILVATPGRLVHLLVEMEAKLSSVQYLVFDEADRLFELGFAEQLKDLLKKLPTERQTLLFSATLPSALAKFARAGLSEMAELVRLDREARLSDQLRLVHLLCRHDDKVPLLLHLLADVIPHNEKTVVFFATKHHVEYCHTLLQQASIPTTCVYSSLDQEARRLNVRSFSQPDGPNILLVTDIAARGIDIPSLDRVINFSFPSTPKLFLHRVGRVARAGRAGTAFSLISSEELGYFVDTHLFLDRPILLASPDTPSDGDGVLGLVPDIVLDESRDFIRAKHLVVEDLNGQKTVADRGYKQYVRTCQPPSAESVRRAKTLDVNSIAVHPILKSSKHDDERNTFLNAIKNFKTPATIFEVKNVKSSSGQGEVRDLYRMMQNTRKRHANSIEGFNVKKLRMVAETEQLKQSASVEASDPQSKDNDNYISYFAKDTHYEKGLEVGTHVSGQFTSRLNDASFDLLADGDAEIGGKQTGHRPPSTRVWDRKRKRYVGKAAVKMIVTESGAKIRASYKTRRYEDWLKSGGKALIEDPEHSQMAGFSHKKGTVRKKLGNTAQQSSELKSADQVMKQKRLKEKRRLFHQTRYNAKRKIGKDFESTSSTSKFSGKTHKGSKKVHKTKGKKK